MYCNLHISIWHSHWHVGKFITLSRGKGVRVNASTSVKETSSYVTAVLVGVPICIVDIDRHESDDAQATQVLTYVRLQL